MSDLLLLPLLLLASCRDALALGISGWSGTCSMQRNELGTPWND